MRIVLLGPPGAGKGTHAKILSKNFATAHLATGDLLRKHIREATELGRKAKDIIEKGNLVPDDLVNLVMFEEMKQAGLAKGFILDGYPRTIGQAEALDKFLKDNHSELSGVLNFATTEKVVIDRLSGRRVCNKCGGNYHLRNIKPKRDGICDQCGEALVQRKDDQPETIKNRLATYDKETKPLIDYYKAKNKLFDIPGDFDVPELQAHIKPILEGLKAAK